LERKDENSINRNIAFKFMRFMFIYFETYASNPPQIICILEATKPVARTFAIYLARGQNDV